MHIQPKRPTAKGPAEWFTGEAWMDAIGEGQGAARMTIGSVHFTPGAYSAWHRHSIGQTLYVTAGEGRVQSRDGTIITIRPVTSCGSRPASGTGTEPRLIIS